MAAQSFKDRSGNVVTCGPTKAIFSLGLASFIRLASKMKEANPKLKIAFVGPHVTTLPERSLNDCKAIDFVCRREFDYSVVEYANGKPLSEIIGISYRDANGKVIHNPDRPDVMDLDALPDVVDVRSEERRVGK